MECVHVGALGLKVSPLCLGTINPGWDPRFLAPGGLR
jgi:hypothetical protein